MNSADIKPGAEVWALDASHVRTGRGPVKCVVAVVNHTGPGRAEFRASGTRGWYTNSEAFETEAAARLAWSSMAEAALRREMARFNKITARLNAWQTAPEASA